MKSYYASLNSQCGGQEALNTHIGFVLTLKHWTGLEKLADTHTLAYLASPSLTNRQNKLELVH